MKVLAVDSATKVAGAAIFDDSGLVAEGWLNTGKTHSQRLLPLVADLLKNADMSLEEMDGFAVSIGPGSFTGLRIGIATIKGFVQVIKKPVAGVVTLDALARNLWGVPGIICPILDARKNEVYCALYRQEPDGMKQLSPCRALPPEALLRELACYEEKVTFLGDGVPVYKDVITRSMGKHAEFAAVTQNLIRASEVAYLGWEKIRQGLGEEASRITPFYIRPSEAEVKWGETHGKSLNA